MSIYESSSYILDLDKVMETNFKFIRKLKNKKILITGATGLICSSIVDMLFHSNEVMGNETEIYIAARNREKVLNRFNKWKESPFFHYVPYDARKQNELPMQVDFVIHGACNATPQKFQTKPVDTMIDNILGLYELLRYGMSVDTENILFISSSEVYGRKNNLQPFSENEYGYLDILNDRAAYPSSKRATESLCIAFSNEYGIKTTIVRPGHIYGPTANRSDNRISSLFAFQAADGENLVLKSYGKQIRSYCYMLDCASAIIAVLVEGKDKNAYNISNSKSIVSIKYMAELLAEKAKVNIYFEKPSRKETKVFNPMDNSSLNSEKIESLGWKGVFDAETGFEHTINIIREGRL